MNKRRRHAVIVTLFVWMILVSAVAPAVQPALPTTALGLANVIVNRLPRGMPIAVARTRLTAMGFTCQLGKHNDAFGPVADVPFLDCDYREAGRKHARVVPRWRVGVVFKDGKVVSVQAEYNPIYVH